MVNKRILFSIFLLTLFIYPQIDKWFHSHPFSYHTSKSSYKVIIHQSSEKCEVCHFEFSLFHLIEFALFLWTTSIILYHFLFPHSTIVKNVVKHQFERGPPVNI